MIIVIMISEVSVPMCVTVMEPIPVYSVYLGLYTYKRYTFIRYSHKIHFYKLHLYKIFLCFLSLLYNSLYSIPQSYLHIPVLSNRFF